MRASVLFILIILVAAYRCGNFEAEAQTVEKCQDRSNLQAAGSNANDAISRFMSVNVPMFYDMVKNGSSMGMNVLSGLVKVERGDEAEKNGLVGNGRRPLSIRILGIPIFERGVRVRPPQDSGTFGIGSGKGEEEGNSEPLAD